MNSEHFRKLIEQAEMGAQPEANYREAKTPREKEAFEKLLVGKAKAFLVIQNKKLFDRDTVNELKDVIGTFNQAANALLPKLADDFDIEIERQRIEKLSRQIDNEPHLKYDWLEPGDREWMENLQSWFNKNADVLTMQRLDTPTATNQLRRLHEEFHRQVQALGLQVAERVAREAGKTGYYQSLSDYAAEKEAREERNRDFDFDLDR